MAWSALGGPGLVRTGLNWYALASAGLGSPGLTWAGLGQGNLSASPQRAKTAARVVRKEYERMWAEGAISRQQPLGKNVR